MNKNYIYFISSLVLILLSSCINSCTSETDNHNQTRVDRTKKIFNDSAKIQMFDLANFKAIIVNNNSIKDKTKPLILNFEIEIKMGFEDMELKYMQPEEFYLNLVIYDNQNNLKEKINLDFDLFDKLYFSYDGVSDNDIAVLQKKIVIDNEYFDLLTNQNVKENLSNKIVNFLNRDRIELVFDYQVDNQEFSKKITPTFTLNSINREEQNFNLTPYLKNIFETNSYTNSNSNSNSKINFEINALKKTEDNSIYFPTSEKVFLNIYKLTFSEVNSANNSTDNNNSNSNTTEKTQINEELVFESNKKMNYLQVVDDNLPFINASKEYYYDWNKKDNSNNYLANGLYRFEIGLRTNKNNDKVNYYIYYK